MSREFDGLYARVGRPSIPPERLLRAQLLQVFYSIRSERLLMEQLDYNLLFRWFVGLDMDEPVWAPTVFTKNRDRLLNQEVARSFFRRVVERAAGLMSDEHFTVDGTLIEAWASQKSFQRKDGGDGRRRARLPRADAHERHARLEDGSGGAAVSQIDRRRVAPGVSRPPADRESPRPDRGRDGDDGGRLRPNARRRLLMLAAQMATRAGPSPHASGADKGYDTRDFVEVTRAIGVTPHVTQNVTRPGGSAIDGRTTRHEGYAMSQHARPRIEPAFGWLKTIAWMRKVKLRGLAEGRLALRLRECRVQPAAVGDADRGTGVTLADDPLQTGRP